MRVLFADTFYWIAFVNPSDDWHQRVRQSFKELQPCKLVTTDEVLTELLTFYSKSGNQLRYKAANLVRGLLSSKDVEVVPQSRQSFMEGLALYEQRLDKGYSIPDCISMNTMKQLSITDTMTHDKHFIQEGFTILFLDTDK
ncbi:MAG: PIN domain-containing protein [Cyanobacteria bacterium P01_D01_bin.36]